MSRKLWVIATGLILSTQVNAKTLYVDGARGDDSVAYATNSEATPWRSLGRAVWGSTSRASPNGSQAARAGDTVMVASGIYTAPATNLRNVPAFNPENSGTADAPIVIRAVGRVELRTEGGTGPAMGTYVRNYIQWIGLFAVDETYVPPHADTGPIVIWDTTGSVVDGCEVRARPIGYVDNHTGVRFEGAHYSAVRNCRITGVVGQVGANDYLHHNKAGVMLYFSDNITIEHNEFTQSGVGVFPKGGDNYNITIRFNRMRNNLKGIRTSYTAPGQGQNLIYQNLITDGITSENLGIELAENSYNVTVANNTISSVQNGLYLRPTTSSGNLRIANNVIANTTTAVNGWEMTAAIPGPGRNAYLSPGQWASNSRTFSTLSNWTGSALSDATSILLTSGFVSTANDNYRLVTGSPAATLGIDLLDLDHDGSTSDVIPAGSYIRGDEVFGPMVGSVPNPPVIMTVQ